MINHVILSVDIVLMVAMTGILEYGVTHHAWKDIMAKTVLYDVLLIVKYVKTQTGCVLVNRAGWVHSVLQNVPCPMERIVSIHAVCTASIRSVTDSMELACSVVQKEKTVIEKHHQMIKRQMFRALHGGLLHLHCLSSSTLYSSPTP